MNGLDLAIFLGDELAGFKPPVAGDNFVFVLSFLHLRGPDDDRRLDSFFPNRGHEFIKFRA